MTLNGDSGNVTGILDQLQVGGSRAADFSIKDSECSENLTFDRDQRSRPHRTNAIRLEQVPIIIPKGVAEDIGYIYWLPAVGRGATGCAFWTNQRGSHMSAESGKTGCGGATQLLSVLIGKPDCAYRAFALRFDQASDDREHFRQR